MPAMCDDCAMEPRLDAWPFCAMCARHLHGWRKCSSCERLYDWKAHKGKHGCKSAQGSVRAASAGLPTLGKRR